ncbi:MAG: hypothetical protein J7L32_05345 [Thermoplasmata archaeon]|nr:hypothetical protein [Thermoplasmata archaeon]
MTSFDHDREVDIEDVPQEWIEEWKQEGIDEALPEIGSYLHRGDNYKYLLLRPAVLKERYKHLLAERERNLAEIKAADTDDLNNLESVGILIAKDISAIKGAAKIRGVKL